MNDLNLTQTLNSDGLKIDWTIIPEPHEEVIEFLSLTKKAFARAFEEKQGSCFIPSPKPVTLATSLEKKIGTTNVVFKFPFVQKVMQ